MATRRSSISHGLFSHACIFLLLICLCIFLQFAQSKPPPGFEELLEPQTTLVDIYFGKRFIGSSLATYTPETVELQDPSGVVALIPSVKDVQLVQDSLTGPLANNGDKICLSEVERDCGMLEPNVADVIFDESRFKLQIFINRLHLEKQQIVLDKFLAPSESDFSTVNLFSTSLSGNDNDDTYSLGATHLASLKESRLQLQWDYSDVRDINIESLSAQRDWAGKAAEIGLFDSTTRNSSFFTQANLLGIRAYSSTDTRTDLEYQDSTEIFLFFSSPTLVEVFKDENLVVVKEYEAGNQQLDTSQFPSGSYPVILKLTDAQGNVREEEYFFVKSSLLPPRDQPLHFFELGQIKESNPDTVWPDSVGESLLRFGTAFRLTDKLGTELEFLAGDGREIVQGGLLYFGSGYYLQGN
ncbi:MAG: TcfC E-set like domain-containing protein, partial [Gammaproteobacteria bacterium]|nr:TcfC E-set like domain-containing protein [Gammaproteobacteria bacterium]